MNRLLGVIGGTFGIFGGLFAVLFGTAFGSTLDYSSISKQGWIAVLVSVVAIIVSSREQTNIKRSGWLLIVSGIVGLVAISFFYVLPCALLVIAGINTFSNNPNTKRPRQNTRINALEKD